MTYVRRHRSLAVALPAAQRRPHHPVRLCRGGAKPASLRCRIPPRKYERASAGRRACFCVSTVIVARGLSGAGFVPRARLGRAFMLTSPFAHGSLGLMEARLRNYLGDLK